MTYRELFYKAIRLINNNKITLGEYEEMTKPLDREVEQESETFKWCTYCKEYDQEKHCCHRWSKVIRDTVEEMKQEQEPVLDKIRADILKECGYSKDYVGTFTYSTINVAIVLQILDKYRGESEVEDGNDD